MTNDVPATEELTMTDNGKTTARPRLNTTEIRSVARSLARERHSLLIRDTIPALCDEVDRLRENQASAANRRSIGARSSRNSGPKREVA